MKDRAGFASKGLPLLLSKVTVSFIEQTRSSVKVKRGRAVINDGPQRWVSSHPKGPCLCARDQCYLTKVKGRVRVASLYATDEV